MKPMIKNNSSRIPNTIALTQFMNETCRTTDNYLYDQIKRVINSRYQLMKTHRHKCCRPYL